MKVFTAVLFSFFCLSASCRAQPYRPVSEAEVLEKLPSRLENRREIQSLRQLALENPGDASAALNLVKRYIELGRAESDPRYYGYAEAALAPWLSTQKASAEALTLSATLHQSRHEFPAALDELQQALKLQPRLAQAWLTRAVIFEVQGNYPAALKSCLPLAKLAPPLTTATCINSALSLSGQAETAYDRLTSALKALPETNATDQQWVQTTLSEIAARLGRIDVADRHFQAALSLNQHNSYLLATYADFLLDNGRCPEAATLLKEETRADTLLLRLTLAEACLNASETSGHVAALKDRFAAGRRRGDASHQGDEARFSLYLLHDPAAALVLAHANWQVQREPRDARILLEAALAAGKPQAAQEVLTALSASGLEDAQLTSLIDRIRALPA
jgi:tetratricopeptide (TPR) repeat protein